MKRTHALMLMAAVSVLVSMAVGQSPCPTQVLQGQNATMSRDLICLVPQVYGPGGLVGTNNGGPLHTTVGHEVHFQASTISSFGPLNSEIGIALSQLPIAPPVAAGFIISGGTVTQAEGFGPVLSERADTVGKHRLFVGASYQFFQFDKVDGLDIRNFGVVLTHESEPGNPVYTNDIVATQNRIDLKVHQMTFVATYGITRGLDISVAVPVLDVRMGVTSKATIFNFEPPPVNHQFITTPEPNETVISPYDAIFTNSHAAMGIGDVTIRAKLRAWQSQNERSALAVGVDVRLPSGDANNFLGAGTWGARPFATISHTGRFVTPHASFGFQGNGDSVLPGAVTTQPVTKAKMPDVFSYAAGADVGFAHRISFTGDFIGQTLQHAPKIAKTTYTDYAGGVHDNVAPATDTVTQLSIAAGGKLRIAGQLLLVGNVLFRLNDAGLHSRPAPLVGLSYTFR
jgi:hypothetical protein